MIYLLEIILRIFYLSFSLVVSFFGLLFFSDYLILFFCNLGILTLDSSYTIQYIINYSYKSPNDIYIFFLI